MAGSCAVEGLVSSWSELASLPLSVTELEGVRKLG